MPTDCSATFCSTATADSRSPTSHDSSAAHARPLPSNRPSPPRKPSARPDTAWMDDPTANSCPTSPAPSPNISSPILAPVAATSSTSSTIPSASASRASPCITFSRSTASTRCRRLPLLATGVDLAGSRPGDVARRGGYSSDQLSDQRVHAAGRYRAFVPSRRDGGCRLRLVVRRPLAVAVHRRWLATPPELAGGRSLLPPHQSLASATRRDNAGQLR